MGIGAGRGRDSIHWSSWGRKEFPGGGGSWMARILVSGLSLPFKIDTGADVTAILEEDYKKIQGRRKLTKPSKILRGPSNQPLPVVGEFVGSHAFQGKHQIFCCKGFEGKFATSIRSINRSCCQGQ